MDTPENALEENRRLRRTMRDLVALSTLPAIWTGLGPDGIARSLADGLLNTLSLDLIFVRMAGLPGEGDVEVVRSNRRPDTDAESLKESFAPLLRPDGGEPPPTIPDPFRAGTLHAAVVRFGVTGDNGVLVACSRRADFPSERDRLLLGVGANQTAIVFQRVRAEQQVREQAERLRTTLASIGDAVITTDTTGRVTNLNAVAESLTGWGNAEAVGQRLDAVFRIVTEHTRQPVENPATRALREGVVVGLANHTVLIRRDGTERAVDDSAAPVRDGEGHVVGCVLVFRDVTERRRLERQAAEQAEAARKLAAIVDSSEDAIIGKTLDGIIQSWNSAAERVFGYAADEAVGRPITMLFPADRLDEEERIITRIRSGERVEHFDTVRLRKDGSAVPISLTISPIRDGEGRIIGASKIARDITERKRLEDQLRQVAADLSNADRRKDEFLATLAHELRNPLAPLRNALQIIGLSPDPDAKERARKLMERQLGLMVRLVDDLMDVSRITRGKVELRKERVQLSAVVGSAVETSRPLIEQMGHELTVRVVKPPVVVDADPTRLAQVFANLLNNAAKYSDRGGHIWLTAEREGSDVVVSVKDTGIGIPPDKLTSIFDMFSQVDRSLEKAQGGLGIGLTLVRRLVEMHDGRVEARSEGVGRGAEFVVRLPLVVEAPVPQRDHGEPGALKSSLRILIVDDNRDGADSLAEMLRLMGNDTRTAYDGQQGVAVTGDFRPDVVLMDIGLPKLNGYEAARRIREQPWGKHAVLIAVTGWGQDEDRRRSHDAGFDHHMVKPVDPAALMKLLAGLQASATNSPVSRSASDASPYRPE